MRCVGRCRPRREFGWTVGGVTAFQGQPVTAGSARGQAIAADVPLSFWGGFDPETGVIIDRRHPLVGHLATGRVLVIPSGRGSCSGSGVLLEAIRNGTAPAAIITSRLDPVISLGCILGDELYASHPPMVVIPEPDRLQIQTGDVIEIDAHGFVTVTQT
jgi:predicted aconitase with swiveling domain